jgi:hypothetical protein
LSLRRYVKDTPAPSTPYLVSGHDGEHVLRSPAAFVRFAGSGSRNWKKSCQIKASRCRLKRVDTCLESTWIQRYRLEYDELMSSFALDFNLRRYSKVSGMNEMSVEKWMEGLIASAGACVLLEAAAADVSAAAVFAPHELVPALRIAPVGSSERCLTTHLNPRSWH